MIDAGQGPAYILGRYPQWTRTFFGVADGLPSGDVTHLAVVGSGELWAATPAGLARWAGEEVDSELADLGIVQASVPLPYDERPMHKWDANPYRLDGGDGKRAEDGTVFLHPYWLARYYGLFAEANEASVTNEASQSRAKAAAKGDT